MTPDRPIDPNILEQLGLTQEDVDTFDRDIREREKEKKELELAGFDAYQQHKQNGHGYLESVQVGTFRTETLQLSREQIPDYLYKDMETPGLGFMRKEKDDSRVRTFLRGFGRAALEDCQWQTAVNAFDIATSRNIFSDPQVTEMLRTVAQQDRIAGVEIAKCIQRRIAQRDQA